MDNQVIIDDPRVSRAHVQLRVTKGRFAIFDLNSTGGTFINGQRTEKSILYPGDVISLAGVTMIFGQDLPHTRSTEREKTGPEQPVSTDNPHIVLLHNGKKDKKKE